MDYSILDNIIIGRVDPHIYAFTTNTVPNYLKVGDTYRPVSIRLQEWREHFPDLQKEYEGIAKADNNIYFRDFAVHYYLEQERRKSRLQQADLRPGVYYSKEFFKETTAQDVIDAVDDIVRDYNEKGGKYQFYDAETRLPEAHIYARTESFEPRPNQAATIRQFKEAVAAGRTNLLMYAVMRFGKSFTSMCCAVEMDAEIVTVVSAKADVKEEWKKTVESHTKFADYAFLTADNLAADQRAIRKIVDGGKKVVVFLTLQDLQGETIKDKHREVFGNQIDLLIVDETHFGARAEKYGQVLRANGYEKDVKNKIDTEEDYVESSDADEQIKVLDARIKLHLSGTPYRILMGSEFSKEDIIAFYQFTDIVKDQEEWIKENNEADEPEEEWNNPYYGFPQMVRFAFNPNESSRRRLKELRESGISYAFSALLKPQSVKKSADGKHKKFIFEQEILDLLEVIDGSKNDAELLGFLDYDRIKSGNMCRHIVMVLPYCASCDAMEELIRANSGRFRNLNGYEIINISGVDRQNKYKSPDDIKGKIRQCEAEGKKTITLTVNRMLTGSTVKEWDTMLFLKDTASPQEYDQAIFRLQNQFVKKYVDEQGHEIKYNMKPQTLLVDFMPGRMFTMQEQKSQIYNVNVDEAGNSRLEERISEELRISPIIVMNSDKMEQVRAADILQAVSEYSKTRGVAEETAEIPVDLSLMDIDAIRAAIEKENELGSKQGFTTKAHDGEDDGSDMDTPTDHDDAGTELDGEGRDDTGDTGSSADQREENKKDPIKQFRSYYARILFFAFLTKDIVISLEDIIRKIAADENARIARHIGIKKSVLSAILGNINKFVLRDLDYKIQNLNKLSHDETLDPIERASVAVRKFGKLGESEVITPKKLCDEMVALIPDDGFTDAVANGRKILDIAGKAGEFALAIYERMNRLGIEDTEIANAIYTIPTSGITYEFTRMVYEILGLNIRNLAIPESITSYKLLDIKDHSDKVDYVRIAALLRQTKPICEIMLNDTIAEGDEKVKFEVVIGNPPYQEKDGGAGASSAPIYPDFVNIIKSIDARYSSVIIPARWYSGGKGGKRMDDFRQSILDDIHVSHLHDFLHPEEVFPGTNNRGGVCYLVWDSNYDNRVTPSTITTHEGEGRQIEVHRNLRFRDLSIFVRYSSAIDIVGKVIPEGTDTLNNHISAAKAFGFRTFFINDPLFRNSKNGLRDPILCYGRSGKTGYVERTEVCSHSDWIDKWKVYVPESNNIGTELNDDNQNAFVGAPNTICTETFLVVGADLELNQSSAANLSAYLKTKFARFLLSLAKNSQHGTAKTYRFVPLQDFSKPWIDAELYEKYMLTTDEIAFIESTIKPMD